MKLYNIYYRDSYGNLGLVATTNNPDKWLETNNKHRIAEGNEPEKLEDFEIETADLFLYKEFLKWT
tara:strand:+ start:468 stop:665 length:198 start_codon:yes stop_codon:yes gene_type:complete